MEFIKTSERVPIPDLYKDGCGKKYIVRLKKFGLTTAMFLQRKNKISWYKDYTSKIVVKVEEWLEHE